MGKKTGEDIYHYCGIGNFIVGACAIRVRTGGADFFFLRYIADCEDHEESLARVYRASEKIEEGEEEEQEQEANDEEKEEVEDEEEEKDDDEEDDEEDDKEKEEKS